MSYLPHNFEQTVERLRGSFTDHTLRLVVDGEAKVYRMQKPGTLVFYVDFVFIPYPERIILTGDLILGANGAVSLGGYGFKWFTDKLDDTYLCEKFLHREYDYESTKAALMDAWREMTYPIHEEKPERERLVKELCRLGFLYPGDKLFKGLMEDIVSGFEEDQSRLYDFCLAFGLDGVECVYKDAPALVVAQETFRRLIHELPVKEGGLKVEVA